MYYLGVDGGGTKTKFSLTNEYGEIICEVNKPTSHYLQVGLDGLTNILNEGIDDICKEAKITRDDIASSFIGAPGFGDIKADEERILDAVKKAFKNMKHAVGNDGQNALAGGLKGEDGINIVAGTGSIGFGHNSLNNKTLSCGGWHHAIGSDEGSGYWISNKVLHEFTRQSDGRDNKTTLYYKLKEYLDIKEDGDIISIVVDKWNLDRTKMASFCKFTANLYKENDPYAIKFIKDAAYELADIIKTLYIKLEFKGKVKVSYTGGVFNMGDIILNHLKSNLDESKFELVAPSLSPDKGSLILALQNDGKEITQTIIDNLNKK